jgi:hypothetical protein
MPIIPAAQEAGAERLMQVQDQHGLISKQPILLFLYSVLFESMVRQIMNWSLVSVTTLDSSSLI